MVAGHVTSKWFVLDVRHLGATLILDHLAHNAERTTLVLGQVSKEVIQNSSLLHESVILLRYDGDALGRGPEIKERLDVPATTPWEWGRSTRSVLHPLIHVRGFAPSSQCRRYFEIRTMPTAVPKNEWPGNVLLRNPSVPRL